MPNFLIVSMFFLVANLERQNERNKNNGDALQTYWMWITSKCWQTLELGAFSWQLRASAAAQFLCMHDANVPTRTIVRTPSVWYASFPLKTVSSVSNVSLGNFFIASRSMWKFFESAWNCLIVTHPPSQEAILHILNAFFQAEIFYWTTGRTSPKGTIFSSPSFFFVVGVSQTLLMTDSLERSQRNKNENKSVPKWTISGGTPRSYIPYIHPVHNLDGLHTLMQVFSMELTSNEFFSMVFKMGKLIIKWTKRRQIVVRP